MQKKTILHFTYRLGRGGAEVMMVRSIKELREYNNLVVEMYGDNSFGDELECDKYITMNLKSLLSLPHAVIKLKKIIRENKIDIVHTHLFWPTVVARIATTRKIPLLTTIHTSVATSLDYKHWHIKAIEKITYRFRKSVIIGVSKTALNEYFTFLKLKPFKSFLLYTFVDAKLFNVGHLQSKKLKKNFSVVSVGALRQGKNFEYLIKEFAKIKNENIELHIYGSGLLESSLKTLIEECKAPVYLKGEVSNLDQILPLYDLYVSASQFEGFSLSILEAMAMKLPLLLSDIASFREQCEQNAVYFDWHKENDFIEKLKDLIDNPQKRDCLSGKALTRVLENFTLDHHITELKKIYAQVVL